LPADDQDASSFVAFGEGADGFGHSADGTQPGERGWCNGVHSHAECFKLASLMNGEHVDRSLARRIGQVVLGVVNLVPGCAGDVYHAPPSLLVRLLPAN